MNKRPPLVATLNSDVFKEYYYLKEELMTFCKTEGLQATGSKEELTNRITLFLKTGIKSSKPTRKKQKQSIEVITPNSLIEEDFVCSEKHRVFFKEQLGNAFTFKVSFQTWLKTNPGKTYQEALEAYYQITSDPAKKPISKQFEYNTYIRDFFKDNKDKSLEQAIKCWRYKKALKGPNHYQKEDLQALLDT